MKKLNKEKLLEWVDRAASLWPDTPMPEERQAYKQIRQLIESQPEVDEEFIEKWEEYIYDVDDYSELDITTRKDIIKKILRDAGVQIKEENT